jgi:Protein of unknown function (DUF2442)
MNYIKHIETKSPLTLICSFINGNVKTIDLSSIVQLPVFKFLNDEAAFKSVVNKGYFIEWSEFEADLSADTLWNWDKTLN